MNEIINSRLIIVLIGVIPLLVGFLKKRKLFLRLFLPSETLVLFVGQIVKKITAIPRPFWQQPQVLGVISNIPTDYSFPSLHTALSTLFAWILSSIYPKLCWLWFGIMAIIAYSRIRLGLHYPQDIIGGFALATIAFWFFYLLAHNQKTLKWGKNPNTRRKLVHLFYGLFLVFLLEYGFINKQLLLIWTGFLFLITIISPLMPVGMRNLILYFERNQKAQFLAIGPLLFTFSSLLAVSLFRQNIALAAILNLAIGDSVNALVGSFWPREKKKRLTASLAAYLAVTLIASQYIPLKISATSSLATLLLEFSEPKIGERKIDDNFFIPLLSGTLMTILS